jgi:hypothetical protein
MTVRAQALLCAASVLVVLAGCALTPNYFRETGPSVWLPQDSATAADVKANYEPAALRTRDWPATEMRPARGIVQHYPLYFEDPFEDKGTGRTDENHPHNVYHAGWEDYVALPYSCARFALNTAALPVSAVVTPPCTVMESDGYVSRQLLGYDHDATRAQRVLRDHSGAKVRPAAPPAAENAAPAGEPTAPPVPEQPADQAAPAGVAT